jgi:plasmid replication initiation protein
MNEEKQKALTLIQPNKVTNAKYHFSESEENLLTLMVDAIQKHMTREKSIQTDLFNQPMITIDTKELGAGNKLHYRKALTSLRKKDISFEWTDDKGRVIETETSLIGAIHNHKETSLIDVTIQTWAIPYLVYIGKGVGGTVFNKTIALTLRGEYTKRLYKICKRWEDRGGFSMSLKEFRETLGIVDKYPKLKDLKKRVLDTSKERMQEGADVYFNYAMDKIGGSRSYNQINFTIHGNNKRKPKQEKTDMYVFVYNMLSIAFPINKSSKAMDLCDKIADKPSEFEVLYNRLKKLKNELDLGEKDVLDVGRLIKYIIKNDYS